MGSFDAICIGSILYSNRKSATPTVQQCKSAKVTVTVEGTTVIGQAQFAPLGEPPGSRNARCLRGSRARRGSRNVPRAVARALSYQQAGDLWVQLEPFRHSKRGTT